MDYARYNPNNVNLAVVVGKSVFLGTLFSVNLTLLIIYHSIQSQARLHVYLICWSVFYTLEFMSTCLFNNSQVDDDSFILEDWDIHAMNALSITEYLIRVLVFKRQALPYTSYSILMILVGQTCRTLAMYTARESFNHYIQREHEEKKHKLVTNGIYAYLRHPSYFGFWWWFVGLQVYMNNIITLAIGGYVLWNFFNKRIQFEEGFLVKFFGNDYVNYRARTRTGIPLVR